MSCHATRCITAVLTMALVGASAASDDHGLDQPRAAYRSMGAAQFGMPADAKYIFCNGLDCPDRTPKTLAVPKREPRPAVALPAPSEQQPHEVSRAKEWVLIDSPAALHSKPARRKRAPKHTR